jgi:hypothetical protein
MWHWVREHLTHPLHPQPPQQNTTQPAANANITYYATGQDQGELRHPDDTASIHDWGHAG